MQSLTTHHSGANATVKTRPFGTRTIRIFSRNRHPYPLLLPEPEGPVGLGVPPSRTSMLTSPVRRSGTDRPTDNRFMFPGQFKREQAPRSTDRSVLRKTVLTLAVVLAAVSGLVASPLRIEWSTGSQAAFRGGTISFTARCTSDVGELTNQWYRNGEPLEGQTTGRLVLGNLQAGDEGDYTLRATNLEGSIETEPARLYVVRPLDDLAVGEIVDDTGLSLPYLYDLPENYDPSTTYPMTISLWGSGPLGFDRLRGDIREYAWATVFRSCGIEVTHPTVLVWPARRPGAESWGQRDYPLLLGMIDRLTEEFSIDTNRVQLAGFSDGGRTAWALAGERPDFFASIMTWATTGEPPDARAVNPLPAWLFCAADDFLSGNNRHAVARLLRAGYRPIYTEYLSGGHSVMVIERAMCNPSFIDWWLDQERDLPSAKQPLVSIAQPTSEAIYVTSRMTVSVEGSADALDQEVRQVKWSNLASRADGVALGTTLWSVTDIPLVADQTNQIVVAATTGSWSGTIPGGTTFHDSLVVVCRPIRVTLKRQGPEATLSWSNGEAPFIVQRASALDPAAWTDLLSNVVAPPVLLPLESTQGFYRIVGQ